MKNIVKGILCLLGIGLVGGTATYLVKKHRSKQLEEEEVVVDEDVVVDEEPIEDEEEEDDDNLPREIFLDVKSVIPDDSIEYKSSESVVHIHQSYNQRKDKDVLDFLFEIPKSAYFKGKRSNITISDYVRVIKGVWNKEQECLEEPGFQEIMNDIVCDPKYLKLNLNITSSDNIRECKTEPFMYVTYKELVDDEWVDVTNIFVLDKSIYEDNKFNPEHTKATEFIQDFYERESDRILIDLDETKYKDVKILDVFMAIRVSFNIQKNDDVDCLKGINKESGLEIIRKIYDNLEIYGNNNKIFTYDNFIFHDLDGNIYQYNSENEPQKIPLYN